MFVRTGADTHARRSAILHAACRDETDSEADRYIPLSGSEALTSSRRRRQWQHDGSGIRDSDACSAWSSSKRMELRPGAGAAHLGQLAAHASRQKGSSLVDPCRAAFSRAAAEEMEMDGDGEQARASGRQDLGMQAAGLGLAVTAGSKTKKKVNFCNDGKVHHPRAGRGGKRGEYTQAHSPRHAWRFFSVDLEKITAFAKAQAGSSEPAGRERAWPAGFPASREEGRQKQSRSRP